MKRFPKSFIRDYLLTALVFILLGVLFLAYPETSRVIMCYIFGGFLCLVGALRIIEYFKTPVSLHGYSLSFVVGLIALGAGIYVLNQPDIFSKMLPTILGITVLLDSLIKLQNTLDMLRLHDKYWKFTLIMTIITIALGAILLLNPFKSVTSLLLYAGISLIINGVMDAIALFALYHRIKQTHKIPSTVPEETEHDSVEK